MRIIDGLYENIASLREKRAKMRNKNEKQKCSEEKFNRFERENAELTEKNRLNKEILIEIEKKIEDLETALDEKKKEKNLDEKRLKEIERLTGKVAFRDTQLRRLEEKFIKEMKKQNKEVKELRNENLAEKARVMNLLKENNKLHKEVEELRRENLEERTKVDDLQKESKINLLKENGKLHKEVEELRREILEERTKVDDQNESKINLLKENSKLHKEVEELRREILEERTKVDDQNESKINLLKENSKLHKEVEELRREILEERTKVDDQNESKINLLKENSKLHKEVEELRREILEERTKVDDQNESKINLLKENSKLHKEVEELRREILEEKTKVDDLQKESKALCRELKYEKLCCKKWKQECAIKDQQISDQEKLLESLRAENEEKSKKLVKLREKLKNESKEKKQDEIVKWIKEGLYAYMEDKIDDAINIFEKLSSMELSDKDAALLHILLATVKSACDNPDDLDIVMDCCKVLEKGLRGSIVYLLRGEHLCNYGLYDVALEDLDLGLRLKASKEGLQKLNEAKKQKQRWEDFNHYQVLGVEQNADKKEILKAHKQLAMKYHPDRHRKKPKFLQDAFEEKFKKIGNAKRVLEDERDRREYDQQLRRHPVWKNDYHRDPHRGRGMEHHWNKHRTRFQPPEYHTRFQHYKGRFHFDNSFESFMQFFFP
ncbi:golgin subfamily A member 6-like protein 6 [Palaemon carinicauda]|uniref:golgin subfamily A member 6-like protein 6 n=1 Tax=Palaemon carinicauda TaxID=392227 RepID=UPI0035B66125